MTENKFTGSTLLEAKQYLRANFEEGCTCPACGQCCKVYKRPITSSMGLCLFLIHRQHIMNKEDGISEFIHVENLLKEANCGANTRADFPKLRFWGLLEAEKSTRNDGSTRNGYYRITDKGIAFIKEEIEIPSHVIIYNNTVLGFSEETTGIRNVFKKKFDYDSLMQNIL